MADGRARELRRRLVAYGLLLLGATLIVLAHWPGLLNPDSLATISAVRSGLITDQLAPVLTWTWRQAYRVAGVGPGAVLILQTAVLTAGLYLVLRAAFGRVAAAALAVVALFAPPTFGLVGLVGRDAWFVSCCLLAAGLAVAALRWSGRARTGAIAVGAVAALVAVAARQNGFTAVMPIMVGLAVPALAIVAGVGGRSAAVARRRRLSAVALGVGVTLAAFAAVTLAGTVVRDQARHPEIYTYLYDLGHLTLEQERRFIPSLPRDVQPVQTLAEVEAAWNPTSGVPLRWPDATSVDASRWLEDPGQTEIHLRVRSPDGSPGPVRVLPILYGDANADRLAAAWRTAIVDHPLVYLSGRAALWRRSIGIGQPPFAPTSADVYRNPFGYSRPSFPVLSGAARDWTDVWIDVDAPTLTGSAVHRVWPYLLACLLGLAFLAPRFRGPVRMVGVLMVAVVGLQVGLFFLPPSAEVRFQLLTFYGAMLAVALAMRLALRGRSIGRPRRQAS